MDLKEEKERSVWREFLFLNVWDDLSCDWCSSGFTKLFLFCVMCCESPRPGDNSREQTWTVECAQVTVCGLKGSTLAWPSWKEAYSIQVAEINLATQQFNTDTPFFLCGCSPCFGNYGHLLITSQVHTLWDEEAMSACKHTHTCRHLPLEKPNPNDCSGDEDVPYPR